MPTPMYANVKFVCKPFERLEKLHIYCCVFKGRRCFNTTILKHLIKFTERCEMIKNVSVNFNCTTRRNQVIPCSDFLPYGTLITPSCKPGHHYPEKKFIALKCKLNGKWNHTAPECKPGKKYCFLFVYYCYLNNIDF